MGPRGLWRTGATLVLLAAALSGCASGDDDADRPAPIGTQTSGDLLPEATFEVLGGGERVSTSDFRGTPSLINFWATWCVYCVEEMPALEEAHQTLGDQVRFVGIGRQDNREKALELAEETGVSYLLLESPDGSYYDRVRARGMPTTLFVDAEGVIRYRHTGAVTTEEVLELVEEHLGVVP